MLEQLVNFTRNVGWDLIYDMNDRLRTSNKTWNSTNAQEIINFLSAKEYTNVNFEIGNGRVAFFYFRKNNMSVLKF